MTGPLDDTPVVAHERRFRMELVALLLLLIGAGLFVYAAWAVDWRAGVGVLGTALIAAGVILGRDD